MRGRPSTRRFAVAVLVLCLALAGGVSYYASSRPDGLNRVAADEGMDRHARDGAADDSPLAGYDTPGIDSGRLSGGLAGVFGVAVVLLATGGLVYAVRRRSGPNGATRPPPEDATGDRDQRSAEL